jgi:hypothetical protein
MLSLATKTDRTLFFDFLPIDLGHIRGMKTKIQLYTVPGQVFYDTTRKLVLKGADGVVFVADSQGPMLEANIGSFENLITNLKEQNQKLEDMPHVIQYNKRDMKNVLSVEELNEKLNRFDAPFFEAVAPQGMGVFETLKGISGLVLKHLNRKYGLNPDRQKSSAMPASPPPQAPPRPSDATSEQQGNANPVMELESVPPPSEVKTAAPSFAPMASASRKPLVRERLTEIEFEGDDEEILFEEETPAAGLDAAKTQPMEDDDLVLEDVEISDEATDLMAEEPLFAAEEDRGLSISAPRTSEFEDLALEEELLEESSSAESMESLQNLDDSEVIELEDMEPLEFEELDEIAELVEPDETAKPLSRHGEPLSVPVEVKLPSSLKGQSIRLLIDLSFEDELD